MIKNFISKSRLILNSLSMRFSTQPAKYSFQDLYDHHWHEYDPTHTKSQKTHKSKAEQYVSRVPVIYVNDNVGGTQIGAGHPQVYIQLNVRDPTKPSVCKYCGLKYMKSHEHHEGGQHH